MHWLLTCVSAAAAVLLALPSPASAAPPPQGPPPGPSQSGVISLVVPFAPGGTSDVAARILSAALSDQLGRPAVVENRTGSGGRAGIDAVAAGRRDGSMLLFTPAFAFISAKAPAGSLVPVAPVARTPYVLVGKPGIASLNDLRSRASPSFAGAGPGSFSQLAATYLAHAIGLQAIDVPFRGEAPALQAVVSGQADAAVVLYGPAKALIQAGRLTALGILGDQRLPDLPQTMTLLEQGVPGANISAAVGLYAPRGTPASVIAQLNTAVRRALADSETARRLAMSGLSAFPGAPSDLTASLNQLTAMARGQPPRGPQSTPAPAAAPPAPSSSSAPPPPAARLELPQGPPAAGQTPALGRRVALVVGNGAYAHVPRLPNPGRDAEAVAQMLRRVGFAEVRTLLDADYGGLTAGLKSFGDLAEGADWAVVYFAGHGIELGGTAFLIPVDARLERDTHVRDEAVALDRVLEKVATARQLRLVVLDACRNNPFAARMVRSAGYTRSVDRGLARIEPDGDVLVAYSAKHGTVAEDGTGRHSPFVTALLEQMPQPGVDIRIMFGRVRDAVRRATNNRQEPYLYGSVGGDTHVFVPAR